MDFTNCNLSYPKLRATPSYGDAMRYHSESNTPPLGKNTLGIHCYGDEFNAYLSTGKIRVDVDWGTNHSELLSLILQAGTGSLLLESLGIEMSVHGIGRRPAMALLASNKCKTTITNDNGNDKCIFPQVSISWEHGTNDEGKVLYPEYLVTLKVNGGTVDSIQRILHVVPPPIGPLDFRLKDIIWAPGLFLKDADRSREVVDSIFAKRISVNDETTPQQRRRGFGLELETVQNKMNADDCDDGCFTHQQKFKKSIERARLWHLSRISDTNDAEVHEMWNHFLRWSVSHDLYVENAAPPSRIDLYQRLETFLNDSNEHSRLSEGTRDILIDLILGGRVEMPPELMSCIPHYEVSTSQASPEYKSPPPPHELYHVFPPPLDGNDDASNAIRLFLDGILKNPYVSSTPVSVPTVSDIGQSATSIHVHVNINNEKAWPRETAEQTSGIEATHSLLCVIFGWICFDRVVQSYFCKPNVWRDRSFASMYATGPEFSWREPSWEHGSSVSAPDQVKLYNIPAWFGHVHACLNSRQEEKKDSRSLFEEVFDDDQLTDTMSRWNSLNLRSLKIYGTVEFRRMHATLHADFVSSWTWFCVGFVEKFSHPSMFDRFLYPFIEAVDWKHGLDNLAKAQHNATIEDLNEIMCGGNDPVLPSKAFESLMCNNI